MRGKSHGEMGKLGGILSKCRKEVGENICWMGKFERIEERS